MSAEASSGRPVAQFQQLKNLHKTAIFCKDPTADGCGTDPREDYTQELHKNPQYNAIVFVRAAGKYIVPLEEDGRYVVGAKLPDGRDFRSGIGVMISPCLVLTNKHVAYMMSEENNIKDLEIMITQKRKDRNGNYSQLAKSTGKVVGSALPVEGANKSLEDLVVLRLKDSSTDKEAVIPTCDKTEIQARRSKSMSLASFFGDKGLYGNTLMGQRKCKIFGKLAAIGGL